MKQLKWLAAILLFASCQKEVDFVKAEGPSVACFKGNLPNLTAEQMRLIAQLRIWNLKKPLNPPKGPKPKPVEPPPPVVVPDAMILIDFDGHVVDSTSWNSNGTIYAEHSGLSLEAQQKILDSVRWDYKDFNVLVSTDSVLYTQVNPKKRMRLIVTASWEWYGKAGGVAFTKSFTWGDDTPCWVFSSLFGLKTKEIQEAASHEVGHTLGLRHQARFVDGVKVEEYHTGDGNEAPIMGVAYYRPIGRWWVGLNVFGATQDDEAIIRTVLF